ncbi:MAG: methyl-accepting chemotaxis protein [Bacteriovoracaceae bacterium]|jgi:methyl-accepting chemotaxis protein|nr:methyl-accepting chemotaxis protein [Bacteriovoracaceae bacterium]
MFFTKKSFKFKIVGVILASFIILLALVPPVINQTIKATVDEYEKKSAKELEIVFNAFLNSHYGSLASQMTNWFSTSAAQEVMNEEPDWEVFKNSLLGIGNSINSSHGVLGISVYDLDIKKVFDYKIENNFSSFDSQQKQLKKFLTKALKTESKTSGEIIDTNGNPLLVLIVPSEDEDEEINFFHVYFMSTEILVNTFSDNIHLPVTLYIGKNKVDSNTYTPFRKYFTERKKALDFTFKEQQLKVRTAKLRSDIWNGKAKLDAIVDVTKIQDAILKIEYIGLAIIGAVIFILVLTIYYGINKLVKSFIEKVNFLQNVANESLLVSSELRYSSEEGYKVAESEAAEVSSTSSAAEEISQTLRTSQEHAQNSVRVANVSRDAATHGAYVIEKMINEIKDVGQAGTDFMNEVRAGNEKIVEIASTLDKISEKTKLINDIVFQTKLLSFNASVEAARAGVHGKGFAVVAQEVGALAQNSGNISNEINDIIESSVVEVKSVIKEILETTSTQANINEQKIKNASSVGMECKDSLEKILQSSAAVDESIGQISAAAQEQAIAVGEIAHSVRKIEHLSRKNKSASNQNKDFAIKMEEQVDSIMENTKQMKELLLGVNKKKDSCSSSTSTPSKDIKQESFKKMA